jgi:hypothetical protein
MTTRKNEIQGKIERIHAARMKIEAFVVAGGDLKSKEALPIGLELAEAFTDLSTEFGYPILGISRGSEV